MFKLHKEVEITLTMNEEEATCLKACIDAAAPHLDKIGLSKDRIKSILNLINGLSTIGIVVQREPVEKPEALTAEKVELIQEKMNNEIQVDGWPDSDKSVNDEGIPIESVKKNYIIVKSRMNDEKFLYHKANTRDMLDYRIIANITDPSGFLLPEFWNLTELNPDGSIGGEKCLK